MISSWPPPPLARRVRAYCVDARGFILQVLLIDEGEPAAANVVRWEPARNLHLPRWNGVSWVEGAPCPWRRLLGRLLPLLLLVLWPLPWASGQISSFPGSRAVLTPPYTAVFSGQTSLSVAASVHLQGTTPSLVSCVDSARNRVEGYTFVYSTSGDVTISFPVAFIGRCKLINGSGGGGPGGGADTTSAANSGAGAQILKPGTNVTAKTLVAGDNVTVTDATDTITIAAIASAAVPPYTLALSAASTATVTAATHGQGATPIDGGCVDAGRAAVTGYSWGYNGGGDVTITFPVPVSVSCRIANGNGGGAGGGGTGDTTTVANSGAGAQVLKAGTNVTARTLVAGTGISITQSTDAITVTSTVTGGGAGTVYTGSGLTGDGSSGAPLRIDPSGGAAAQAMYTTSLTFGTVAANSCMERNIAASGAVGGDTVAPGWPATLPASVVGHMYGATDSVVVRLCNVGTAGAAVPDGLNFSARILRSF